MLVTNFSVSELGFMPDKYNIDADSNCNDEVSKIRNEFEEAKRNFLNIPAALKEMPTMNPEGVLF